MGVHQRRWPGFQSARKTYGPTSGWLIEAFNGRASRVLERELVHVDQRRAGEGRGLALPLQKEQTPQRLGQPEPQGVRCVQDSGLPGRMKPKTHPEVGTGSGTSAVRPKLSLRLDQDSGLSAIVCLNCRLDGASAVFQRESPSMCSSKGFTLNKVGVTEHQ